MEPVYIGAEFPCRGLQVLATMSSPTTSLSHDDEKRAHHASPSKDDPERVVGDLDDLEDSEVFKINAGVDFRTVGWPRATVIFLKLVSKFQEFRSQGINDTDHLRRD